MQTDVWVPIAQAAEMNGRTAPEFLERVKLGKIHSKRSIASFGRTVYWGTDAEQDKLSVTDTGRGHDPLSPSPH